MPFPRIPSSRLGPAVRDIAGRLRVKNPLKRPPVAGKGLAREVGRATGQGWLAAVNS
ncbi:MAG TPA: hypothetical protein VES59_07720 [Bacteroidota bacterium]|nr:hypothetical protein [Bacteroidota bacterium]